MLLLLRWKPAPLNSWVQELSNDVCISTTQLEKDIEIHMTNRIFGILYSTFHFQTDYARDRSTNIQHTTNSFCTNLRRLYVRAISRKGISAALMICFSRFSLGSSTRTNTRWRRVPEARHRKQEQKQGGDLGIRPRLSFTHSLSVCLHQVIPSTRCFVPH